jgi:hypothetical protein
MRVTAQEPRALEPAWLAWLALLRQQLWQELLLLGLPLAPRQLRVLPQRWPEQ